MIDKIYNNQLDALLFSVNQYSEDVAGRLQYKLNVINEEENSTSLNTQLTNFVKENPSILKIVFTDSAYNSSDLLISQLLKSNRQKIERLYSFKKKNIIALNQ